MPTSSSPATATTSQRLAERVLPWLARARASGIDVIVGDPGRRYLPMDQLDELAAYDVRTTTELEDLERKQRPRVPAPKRGRQPRLSSARGC